jgi:hypothetical protein
MPRNSEIIHEPEYKSILNDFESGSIIDANRETLQRHLLTISQNATGDDAIQARDIVQALTINHLILQRHIDGLERRSNRTQNVVILLTVASLLGTGIQSWFSYRADVQSAAETNSKVLNQINRPEVKSPKTFPTPASSTKKNPSPKISVPASAGEKSKK